MTRAVGFLRLMGFLALTVVVVVATYNLTPGLQLALAVACCSAAVMTVAIYVLLVCFPPATVRGKAKGTTQFRRLGDETSGCRGAGKHG